MRWGGQIRASFPGGVSKEMAEESLACEPVLLGCLGLAYSPPSKALLGAGVLVMG